MEHTDPDLKFDGTKAYSDTHPDIERRMIELMRTLTPAQKVARISNMGRFMKQAAFASAKRRLQSSNPHIWPCSRDSVVGLRL